MIVQGAGILFYVKSQQGPLFLIGQECANGRYREADAWSELGGKRSKNETPEMTAAREAWEESLGLVGTYEELLERLQSGESRFKFDCEVNPGVFYRVFLLELVPYCDVPACYTNVLHYLRTSGYPVRSRWIEKRQLRWVSLRILRDSCQQRDEKYSQALRLRSRFRIGIEPHFDALAQIFAS